MGATESSFSAGKFLGIAVDLLNVADSSKPAGKSSARRKPFIFIPGGAPRAPDVRRGEALVFPAKLERALHVPASSPVPQNRFRRVRTAGAPSKSPRAGTLQYGPRRRSGGHSLPSNAKSAAACPKTGRRGNRKSVSVPLWTAGPSPSPVQAPRRQRLAPAGRQTPVRCAQLQRPPANISVKWATKVRVPGRHPSRC